MVDPAGRWNGRLIDIQGFEGSLELLLEGDTEIRGQFSVAIGVGHDSARRTGEVQGRTDGRRFEFELVSSEETPIRVALRGDITELKDGGLGLSGEYETAVDAPFSPLQGGIVVLGKDRKPTSSERKVS